MPTDVFYRLGDEKRGRVYAALKKEFSRKLFYQASVKDIVEALHIARGSFYQYFDSLADSYFAVLEKETVDMHELFIRCFNACGRDLAATLERFGRDTAEQLFCEEKHMIYKSRYLCWTQELDEGWRLYRAKAAQKSPELCQQLALADTLGSDERMQHLKAVVHSLIRRVFEEGWDQETFLNRYSQHMEWIQKGVYQHGTHGNPV